MPKTWTTILISSEVSNTKESALASGNVFQYLLHHFLDWKSGSVFKWFWRGHQIFQASVQCLKMNVAQCLYSEWDVSLQSTWANKLLISVQSISGFVLILTIRKLNSIRTFLFVGRIPCLDLSKMTPHLWLLMVSFSLHWPEVPEGSSASLSSASGGHSSMSSGTYHTGLKASCENSKVKCLIAVLSFGDKIFIIFPLKSFKV